MNLTSLYHSDEVTPRYGVCKNLLFSQISGNFGAYANSVHQALLSSRGEPEYKARAWLYLVVWLFQSCNWPDAGHYRPKWEGLGRLYRDQGGAEVSI